jgi:hypothetical protein
VKEQKNKRTGGPPGEQKNKGTKEQKNKRTKNKEPRTKSQEQRAKNKEPRTKNQEPRTKRKKQEPVALRANQELRSTIFPLRLPQREKGARGMRAADRQD